MVFYFSGTGNSRFVAEKIAEATGQKVIDITTYTKSGQKPVFAEEEVYFFSCPSYMSAPARIMTEFIESATFPQGVSAYFAVTCASSDGISPRVLSELCSAKGMEYKGTARIRMPQNYIALFTTKDDEECRKIIKDAALVIESAAEAIRSGSKIDDKKIGNAEYAVTKWVRDVYYKDFMKTKKFFATDKCVSCSLCAGICPLSNITVKDNKVMWGDNCTHCMACINRCPQNAIEYGKGTVNKIRYKGPDIIMRGK